MGQALNNGSNGQLSNSSNQYNNMTFFWQYILSMWYCINYRDT